MIRPQRLLSACLFWPLFAPVSASALSVEIQGTRLEISHIGASCVEIAGSYPGVRIEPSEDGKTPRICYNSNKINSITILDTTFVAQEPVKKDVLLKFEHAFPAGINGKVMTRAKLQGFFSTADGVGIPSGDKISLSAFFSQGGHEDTIAEPLNQTVGDSMDSALFDYSVKEQYLISGPRTLKGVLNLTFEGPGHKLTLTERSAIALDTGSTMADKLELMEPAPVEVPPAEEAPQTEPGDPTAPQQNPPAAPIPLPQPSGSELAPAPLDPRQHLPFTTEPEHK